MNVQEFKKIIELINSILVLVKDFLTLTLKINFIKH